MLFRSPAIPQRIYRCHGTRTGHNPAPGVVDIGCYRASAGIHHADHVTLEIQHVIVSSSIVDEGIGTGPVIINNIQRVAALRLPVLLVVLGDASVSGAAKKDYFRTLSKLSFIVG